MPHPVHKKMRGTYGNRSLTNVKGWPPGLLKRAPLHKKGTGMTARPELHIERDQPSMT
jgi:hypothetical protein